MKKSILILITFILTISTLSFAETHVIIVDQNSVPDSTETVTTIQQALELAEELNPSEDLPVLIKLGQGEFLAPDTEWEISSKWIFFAGNGPENTRIVADKIEINPEAITSFKNIYIDSVLDIGDNFLPVGNTKILQLEKKEGQLEGVWQNAIGKLQVSDKSITDLSKNVTNIIEISSSIPSNEENNVIQAEGDYVLKSGDTMTGPLEIDATLANDKIVTQKYSFSQNLHAYANTEINRSPNYEIILEIRYIFVVGSLFSYTGDADSIINQVNNDSSCPVTADFELNGNDSYIFKLTAKEPGEAYNNAISFKYNDPISFLFLADGTLSGGGPVTTIRQQTWEKDGLFFSTPITVDGELSAGNLTVPNINLYSTSNIYGYLVSGSSRPNANGIYFDNGNINNGMPIYENENGILIWKYYYANYWILGPNLDLYSYYSYCSASNAAKPLGYWSGCTVSEHEQPVPPKINFANGKAINLQDGVDSQDAATIGQIDNKISETKTYVDNKQFTTENISDGAITQNKIANNSINSSKIQIESVTAAKLAPDVDDKYINADDINGDTMSGPLTVPEINVQNNWVIGSIANPQDISLVKGKLQIKDNNTAGSGSTEEPVEHDIENVNYLVIITPTTTPPGLYSVAKNVDNFTVECVDAFEFDYLIIKR